MSLTARKREVLEVLGAMTIAMLTQKLQSFFVELAAGTDVSQKSENAHVPTGLPRWNFRTSKLLVSMYPPSCVLLV